MPDVARIVEATPLHGRWIRLRFSDGMVQEIDLGPVFARGGVFQPIHDDDEVFAQVRVSEMGTVEWPGEVDLCPDVLYGSYEAEDGVHTERRMIATPDTSARAIRERLGVRQATPDEVDAFMAEHREHMLPPDGEG